MLQKNYKFSLSADGIPRCATIMQFPIMSFSLVLSLVTATLAVIVPVSNREVAQGKSQSPSALVNLGYSQYQGISLPGGVNQYLGMRFAAVPTGICSV